MRPSEDLFQLIKSLSKSEKRYFKLMASVQKGETNYMRLFDLLEEMPEYDEDAVRAHFAGERFINQLNVTKHYLYELILKSLRAYHTEYSARAQITDLLKSAEILHAKGLRDQRARLVEKAIALAKEHEEFMLLLQALKARNIATPPSALSTEEIDARFDELRDTVECQGNLIEYERLAAHVNTIQCNGGARAQRDYQLLERCRWNDLMSSWENAKSTRARFLHLAVMAHYDYEHNNLDPLEQIVSCQVELLESNPALLSDHPLFYLHTLANRSLLFKRLGDIPRYREALAYFRERGERLLADKRLGNDCLRSMLFYTYHRSLMAFHTTTGLFEESAGLTESMEKGLKEHAPHIPDYELVRLLSLASLIEFGRGKFGSALDFNNRILAMPQPDGSLQVYYHARLLNLVIHYELGNMDLLSYLIPANMRYYASRGRLERFERTVLKFFRRLLNTPAGERHDVMCAFRDDLLEFRDDPASRNALNSFTYIEWVISKIEQRTMSSVLQEYLKRECSALAAA